MAESTPTIKLYVELVIAILTFGALVYFMNLHVTEAGITVPFWVIGILLTILGGTLGIDMLTQYRGNS